MSESPAGLLCRLAAMQSAGNAAYPAGIFPSQRTHAYLPYWREDGNIFFSACIAHILQQCRPWMGPEERSIADGICAKVIAACGLFRNKDGLDTYNYWPTRPSRHFPNGWLMHRFEHFRIPDDIDDTALVYLIQGADAQRAGWLREKLKGHANLAYRQARNALPKYRGMRVYSTFIGKRMYIDFDLCALSNLMRVLLPHFAGDLNGHDRDTLEFITAAVEADEHRHMPYRTSPQYASYPVTLYHLGRLLPLLPEPYGSRIGDKVRGELAQLHSALGGCPERILLENVMLQQGLPCQLGPDYPLGIADDTRFHYYIAGLMTAYEGALAQWLAAKPLTQLRYVCGAFNLTLIIENRILRRARAAQ